ncbi:hypothetical protein HWI79_2082 [Cryptosporidium felis]|nr:hypothetical protein HWI79_2082 [Cryptosporidium felis]
MDDSDSILAIWEDEDVVLDGGDGLWFHLLNIGIQGESGKIPFSLWLELRQCYDMDLQQTVKKSTRARFPTQCEIILLLLLLLLQLLQCYYNINTMNTTTNFGYTLHDIKEKNSTLNNLIYVTPA